MGYELWLKNGKKIIPYVVNKLPNGKYRNDAVKSFSAFWLGTPQAMGVTDFAIGSQREVLQAAFTNGLIDNDMWLRMLKCRNALAHDYDGEYAMAVYQQIITEYYPLFVQFSRTTLQSMISDI